MYFNKDQKFPEISWSSSGDSFFINDETAFTTILPNFFSSKKFNSFVRQLNFYSFSKVRNNEETIEFRNNFFQRNRKSEIAKIKRKKRIKKNKKHLVKRDINWKEEADRVIKDRIELREVNKQLKSKLESFKKKIQERINKFIRAFCLMIYFSSYPLLFNVYVYMFSSGLLTGINTFLPPNKEVNIGQVLSTVKTRVQKLIFFAKEEDNYLDGFYKVVMDNIPKDKINKEFLIGLKEMKEFMLKYLLGEKKEKGMSLKEICKEMGKEEEEEEIVGDGNWSSRSIKLSGLVSDVESVKSFNGYLNYFD